jgi:Fic family protein
MLVKPDDWKLYLKDEIYVEKLNTSLLTGGTDYTPNLWGGVSGENFINDQIRGLLGKREKLAKEFLLKLYSAPIIFPREAEQKLGVTAATTNRLIAELEKIGILREKTGYSRNRLYTLHKYLEIFRQ